MSKNWLWFARDDQGQIIKAWTKEHFLCEPVMVEAAVFLFHACRGGGRKKF
jgi:hypothetical protein